jgi:esterase/lipase
MATPVMFGGLFSGAFGIGDPASLPYDGMSSIQGVMVKNAFFRELMVIDIDLAIKSIEIPTLVIHGKNDAVVSVDNAYHLHSTLRPEKKLVIIEDGDHNLTDEKSLNTIKENIIQWLRAH